MSWLAPSKPLASTLTPFLYPCLDSTWICSPSVRRNIARQPKLHKKLSTSKRCQSNIASAATEDAAETSPSIDVNQYDHLNPQPPDYTTNPFTDSCTITLGAGSGGHGCISFLREKYIANGPPNGGDGGTGGNVYIQAVRGETSLHKLARRGILKAGRGRNGQGGLKGGRRGEDVLVQVPVGTVVREISRHDPLAEEGQQRAEGYGRGYGADLRRERSDEDQTSQTMKWRRDKWLIYPGTLPKSFSAAEFPPLPRPRRSALAASEPPQPIRLDLDKSMESPMLLAAGAVGGLGNPNFVTKSLPRPKFATKGEDGARIQLHLELKLLADVGLVGLPNAGKSTLLRAVTNSRTRVGNWAFTTLSPTIGTVVLDSNSGRPSMSSFHVDGQPRTNFTIADIPGLIEDAHLDRGLGLGFLRHIERAGVLAFVVDLSAGDAIAALNALWREVGEYEKLREQELNTETERAADTEEGMVTIQPFESSISPGLDPEPLDPDQSTENIVLDPQANRKMSHMGLVPISSKPWFVVATKADLPDTQENFLRLQEYLRGVQNGSDEHPSGKMNGWRREMYAVPVSAINKEGVGRIVDVVLRLLA